MNEAIGKGSGIIAIACLLLGLLLIMAAIRGTYVDVWHAFTTPGTGNQAYAIKTAGGLAGGAVSSSPKTQVH